MDIYIYIYYNLYYTYLFIHRYHGIILPCFLRFPSRHYRSTTHRALRAIIKARPVAKKTCKMRRLSWCRRNSTKNDGKIHHAINGKTHYFDWAIFNSYVWHNQRVWYLIWWDIIEIFHRRYSGIICTWYMKIMIIQCVIVMKLPAGTSCVTLRRRSTRWWWNGESSCLFHLFHHSFIGQPTMLLCSSYYE